MRRLQRKVTRKARQSVDWLLSRFGNRALILMYHQVAEPDQDPWALAVTPQHFAEHLQILRQVANPMSLQALAQAHQEGNIPERAVAITFDDGYVDNFNNATPLLEKYEVPATFFIATGYTGQNQEFWWDELARIILAPGTLPSVLTLTLAGQTHTWQLGPAIAYTQADQANDRRYKPWEAPPGSRLAFYTTIWGHLRSLSMTEQQQAIAEIRAWAQDTSTTRADYRPMTIAEIRQLDQGGIVTIGAHTVSHPNLAIQPLEQQRTELKESKQTLENWLNRPVTLFAYPFGDYAPETVPIVQEVGFSCACTTVPRSVWSGSDRFQLPRQAVENWSGEEFAQYLSLWFNS